MADWKQIPDTDVDPDAPVTSELMYALRDNPVAIAEGAVGAPRVSPKAMTSNLLGYFGPDNGRVGVSDVGWVKVLKIKMWASHSSANKSFLISFSNDNGLSWSADHSINNGLLTGRALIGGEIEVNLLTGQYSGLLPKYNNASPFMFTQKSEGVIPGVTQNINAVRIYLQGSQFESAFWSVGGRDDV